MASTHGIPAAGTTALTLRKVAIDEPTLWLEAGWHDLWRSPGISLSFGLAFAAVGWLLAFGLDAVGLGSMILPLAAGFLLVAPVAAVGLYEVSRRHAAGEPTRLSDALGAWRRNADQIGLMGVALLVVLFVWIQVALILFAMFFNGAPPSLASFAAGLLSVENVPFLVVGTAAGAVLAAVVFAISAVSLPMLVDRQVTAADAILASLITVRRNRAVMLSWAGVLALLAGIGIATFFIGLIITLPLAGHASWHAYRALVKD